VDYVKDEIISRLHFQSHDEISRDLEVDISIITSIAYVVEKGETFGDIMTSDSMERIYTKGLTYSEIAFLKGITKTGVRLSIKRMAGNRLPKLKEKHKESRTRIRSNIQKDRIRRAIAEKGKEQAANELGYKDSYYAVLRRKYVRKEA